VKLLEKTQHIRKNKCELHVSAHKEGYQSICQVECTGRSRAYKWTHLFPSIYDGYAMLLEKHLIDLSGKRFLIHQVNEHSKGGHYEFEIQLMNLKGKVLNQFSSRQQSNFIGDDQYLWFLKTFYKSSANSVDRGMQLIKLNTIRGKADKTIILNYAQLLDNNEVSMPSTQLMVKDDEGFLQIRYTDKSHKRHTKFISFNDF
jgi:hypothetical protein